MADSDTDTIGDSEQDMAPCSDSKECAVGDGSNLSRPANSSGKNPNATSESLRILGAGQAYKSHND